MSWPVIPKIVDGETTFSATDMNKIIDALQERTELLKENISNDTVLNGVGFVDIGFTKDCHKGRFVAYDKDSQQYIPATALWNSSNEVPPANACVVGMLLTEPVDNQATVLVSGVIRNAEMIKCITNTSNPIAGEYYLTDNGYITHDTSAIQFPIHCGTLVSTGVFVLGIQIPDFRTHTHTEYQLDSNNWVASGNNYVYDSSNDGTLATILRTYISGLVLVVDHMVYLEGKDYTIENGVITLNTNIKPTSSCIFKTNPFTGIIPWIKGVETTNNTKIIKATQDGEVVLLEAAFPKIDNINNGKAVADINAGGVVTCDVVNNITAGPGISVTNTSGDYTITSTLAQQQRAMLNIVNGSGIVYGGDSDTCILKFPANRTSQIVGTICAPSNYNTNLSAKVFIYVASNNVSGLSCNAHVMTALADSINSTNHSTLSFSQEGSGTISNYVTASFDVEPSSLININIKAVNPSSTLSVYAVGVIFEPR